MVAVAICFAACAIRSARTRPALAAGDAKWSPSVRYQSGEDASKFDSYARISGSVDLAEGKKIGVFIEIKDESAGSSSYRFARSKTELDRGGLDALSGRDWTALDVFDDNYEEKVGYLWQGFEPDPAGFEGWYYFRRNWFEDGASASEYASIGGLHVQYSLTTEGSEPKILRATATAAGVPYDGKWVSKGIEFRIITKAMNRGGDAITDETMFADFDSRKEKLRFSIDGGREWHPTAPDKTGKFEIKGLQIKDKTVLFRLTNAEGSKFDEYEYGANEGESRVKMDTLSPMFSLDAITKGLGPNPIEKPYSSGEWTTHGVTFEITPPEETCSKIAYQCATGDDESFRALGDLRKTFEQTAGNIRFRAVNEAGTAYLWPETFDVCIDPVEPCVRLAATTPDPNDETTAKPLVARRSDALTAFGYANGSIEISAENRSANGYAIENASGTTFWYMLGTKSGDGFEYDGNKTELRADDKGRRVLRAEIGKGRIKEERAIKFGITSGAGLESEERDCEFVLLRSAYMIEYRGMEADLNADGWIKDKATVTVSLPADSRLGANREYTKPTVEYVMRYAPTSDPEIVGEARGEASEFDRELAGGEVRWLYRFDLRANADSAFKIWAINSAGKKSINEAETDRKIRIDVLEPEIEARAFVQSLESGVPSLELADASDPGWVNGQIALRLRVRVGVSGIYAKEMRYAVDKNGEIVRDATTREPVWQEMNAALDVAYVEERDGATYDVFEIRPDLGTGKSEFVGSREYMYRIFTNSGKRKDFKFVANIDNSTSIGLKSLSIRSGAGDEEKELTKETRDLCVDLKGEFDACADAFVEFASTVDRPGVPNHFVARYAFLDPAEVSGMTGAEILERANDPNLVWKATEKGEPLKIEIPKNAIGDRHVAVFVENRAINYKKESNKSEKYVIRLHYDTHDLSIGYALSVDGASIEGMQGGNWMRGILRADVTVATNNAGGLKFDSSYKFFYRLLKNRDSRIGAWSESPLGEDAFGEARETFSYWFFIPFENESFKGYLEVSIRNGAGHRSEQVSIPATLIMIDNTTPSVDDAVTYAKIDAPDSVPGERAEPTGADGAVLSYHHFGEIQLKKPAGLGDRSAVRYHYKLIQSDLSLPTTIAQTEFAELDAVAGMFEKAGATLGADRNEVKYAIYARNAVGALSDGATLEADGRIKISRAYRFVYDPGEISGTFANDKNGLYVEKRGMYTYSWKDEININVSASSNTVPSDFEDYVMYQFSADGGATWLDYRESCDLPARWRASGATAILTFTPASLAKYEIARPDGSVVKPFENGVRSAFSFRARNKAGRCKTFGDSVFIEMEDVEPDFDVFMFDAKNREYDGGSTDLGSKPAAWSDGPIRIEIKNKVVPVSGVTYAYRLETASGASGTEGGDGKELRRVGDGAVISTDTLDGFNRNGDAVLVITARSNGGIERKKAKKYRIAVDSVVPEFALVGQAVKSQSTLAPAIVFSGDWTNRDTVRVSRSAVATNASEVSYYFSRTDKDSAVAGERVRWDDAIGALETTKSCAYLVEAVTESGLRRVHEFKANIDTAPPKIKFFGGMNVIQGEEYFIDLKVYVEETNIAVCEYITIKGDERGFPFNPDGYILSTSSVDNSTRYDREGKEYRGYVKVYVRDYAGNAASIDFYVLPFRLSVNNLTLTDEDAAQIREYEDHLERASEYIETSRKGYFANLISRLNDRKNTLEKEIQSHRDYLEKVASRTSFELRSDYVEMYEFMKMYNDCVPYGRQWMQTAITGDSTSKYYGYFQTFETEFGKLRALMDAVRDTEKNVVALPAINMVERKDYADILRVFNCYRNLNDDQKACFASNLNNKLTELKKKCETLLLTDVDTGVALDGNLPPGAETDVTAYGETTEVYANAQDAIVQTADAKSPRKIVSIYRVELKNVNNDADSSGARDLGVTLPIAEEFQDYIEFAVYRVKNDGTILLVQGTEIMPDGKFVQFKADNLSTETYALCVKAAMAQSDAKDDTYGTILGLDLDVKMIRFMGILGGALFGLILLVVIAMSVRHRKFLDTYNRAYRNSIYRKKTKSIPKGNKL